MVRIPGKTSLGLQVFVAYYKAVYQGKSVSQEHVGWMAHEKAGWQKQTQNRRLDIKPTLSQVTKMSDQPSP